jgi:hypothetical protein
VYRDLKGCDGFKEKLSNHSWNEIQQSSVRVSIFQDQYDRSSAETMQGYFLRYGGLAANLQPPLRELDLVNALISHCPADIHRVVLSGSLKSIQDTVPFLAKTQSLETDRDANKGNRRDPNSRDSNKGPPCNT